MHNYYRYKDMASARMSSVLEICTCALRNKTLYSGRGRGGVGALARYRPNSAAADGVGEDTKDLEEAKGKRWFRSVAKFHSISLVDTLAELLLCKTLPSRSRALQQY